MSTFDSQFAASSRPALQEFFGEAVTYVPRTGATRAITAVWIERDQRQGVAELPDSIAPSVRIAVEDDATTGISQAELDLGGDRITYTYEGESKTRPIQSPPIVRGGVIVLEVT